MELENKVATTYAQTYRVFRVGNQIRALRIYRRIHFVFSDVLTLGRVTGTI